MATLKMKIGSESYNLEIDPDELTLDEHLVLQERFAMADMSAFRLVDANQLRGVCFLAVKRKHPDMSDEDALAKIGGLKAGKVFEDIGRMAEEQEQAADPQPAGGEPAAGDGGSPATRRKAAGARR